MAIISIASAKLTEDRAGNTGSMRFVVTLSAPAAQEVTLDYTTADSAKAKVIAAAGTDYTSTSGTLTFAIGQTVAYIDVDIIGDAEKESEEGFDINLSNAVGATLGKGDTLTATGTITDDEPSISIAAARIDESAASTGGVLRFLVTLSAAAPQDVTVDYLTAGGTKDPASGGSDYSDVSGTLTIPVGKKQAYIEVPILNDTEIEADETISLTLNNPTGAGFSKSDITEISAVGTILDDESSKGGSGTLSVSATSGYEGETLYFTVSLSAPSSNTVTVGYAASNIKTKEKTGAAKLGSDFDKSAGTLTFLPGETAKVVAVQTRDDSLWEGNETFDFVLSKVKGAALTGNVKTLQTTGTLLDDEPTISATAATFYEPTIPAGGSAADLADNLKLMRFAVSLSAPASNEVSVDYSFSSSKVGGGGKSDSDSSRAKAASDTIVLDTTAKAGKDFVATHGTLTFAPGDVTAYATVEILDDALAEADETFDLVLSKPSGGAFAGNAKTITVVGTILDNEPSIDF